MGLALIGAIPMFATGFFLLGLVLIVVVIILINSTRRAALAPKYSQPDTDNPTQLDLQIQEINHYLKIQKSLAVLYDFLDTALTALYYAAATVLISAFIVGAAPQILLGTLGISVLVYTFIHQMIRPELRKSSARRRVTTLAELVRRAEIGLTAARAARDYNRAQELALEFLAELNMARQSEISELNRVA